MILCQCATPSHAHWIPNFKPQQTNTNTVKQTRKSSPIHCIQQSSQRTQIVHSSSSTGIGAPRRPLLKTTPFAPVFSPPSTHIVIIILPRTPTTAGSAISISWPVEKARWLLSVAVLSTVVIWTAAWLATVRIKASLLMVAPFASIGGWAATHNIPSLLVALVRSSTTK